MKCDECGQALPEDARFCTACGRRVETSIVCPQCQTQAPPGAKFCFKCGAALGAAAATPRPEPPKAAAPREPSTAPRTPTRSRPPAPAGRVEPRLDLENVRGGDADSGSPGGRKEPTVRTPRPGPDEGGAR